MANTDRVRKLLVRTALVTSTTIATLVGAQNFAMLDARTFIPNDINESTLLGNAVDVTPELTFTPIPVTRNAPEITILQVAPSVTILRQSGQANLVQSVTANVNNIQPPVSSVIQPPAPSQITAPQPIVVQQPAPQRSRSTR